MPENAILIFTPRIRVAAENVALMCSVSIDRANRILSNPETKDLILRALDQSFHETVNRVLAELTRIPAAAVPSGPSPRVDCAVSIPPLPPAKAGFI